MPHWAHDAVFYHIYPLGLCEAPQHNDFFSPAQPRLDQLYGWIDHIQALGADALYLDLVQARQQSANRDLARAIGRLARVRHGSPALRHGDYRQLEVRHEQLAFARQSNGECVIVAVNASDEPVSLELDVPTCREGSLVDLLNPGDAFPVRGGRAHIDAVWPYWARIMRVSPQP